MIMGTSEVLDHVKDSKALWMDGWMDGWLSAWMDGEGAPSQPVTIFFLPVWRQDKWLNRLGTGSFSFSIERVLILLVNIKEHTKKRYFLHIQSMHKPEAIS